MTYKKLANLMASKSSILNEAQLYSIIRKSPRLYVKWTDFAIKQKMVHPKTVETELLVKLMEQQAGKCFVDEKMMDSPILVKIGVKYMVIDARNKESFLSGNQNAALA